MPAEIQCFKLLPSSGSAGSCTIVDESNNKIVAQLEGMTPKRRSLIYSDFDTHLTIIPRKKGRYFFMKEDIIHAVLDKKKHKLFFSRDRYIHINKEQSTIPATCSIFDQKKLLADITLRYRGQHQMAISLYRPYILWPILGLAGIYNYEYENPTFFNLIFRN